MTCQEFTERLPDYFDETLDDAVRIDAHRHLEACRDCQHALRRAQALGRSLQVVLERETAHLVLTSGTRDAILEAARSIPAEASPERSAWRWLFGHPLRALAAVAALSVVLFATGYRQRSDQRAEHRHARTWSIDVPFQSGRQVGLIHADFSEP